MAPLGSRVGVLPLAGLLDVMTGLENTMITPNEFTNMAANIVLTHNAADMEGIREHIDTAIKTAARLSPMPKCITVQITRDDWAPHTVDAVLAEYESAGWGVRKVPRALAELFIRKGD